MYIIYLTLSFVFGVLAVRSAFRRYSVYACTDRKYYVTVLSSAVVDIYMICNLFLAAIETLLYITFSNVDDSA